MNTAAQENETKNLTVLLVVDEPIVQMVVIAMLKKLGCAVVLAETGKDALAKFSTNTYDIILMDIGLPDMRGTDVTKEIRRREVDKHTPIIAVTAYTIDEVKVECDAAGMDAIYNKPLPGETLEEILLTYARSTVKKV